MKQAQFRADLLLDLTEKATSIYKIESFIQELMRNISICLETEFVYILQMLPNTESFMVVDGLGWKKGFIGTILTDPDDKSQLKFTISEKEIVFVKNYYTNDKIKISNHLTDYTIVSGFTLPIIQKGSIFGIIGAFSSHEIDFTEEHKSYLKIIGNILVSQLNHQETISKLIHEEEKYRYLIEYASDAIIISDKEGIIIDVNEKACELTKYTRNELLAEDIDNFYSILDVSSPISMTDLFNQKTVIVERKFIQKDANLIDLEISLRMLPDGTIQGICRDITERKKSEELIQRAQKMEAMGRLAGEIAHDFNNYLTVIIGHSEKLLSLKQKDLTLEHVKNDAMQIKKTSDQASGLIKDLLSFSRNKRYNTQVLNVNKIIRDLAKSIDSFLGEKVKIIYELDDHLKLIKTDTAQLRQSILNLIINAKDAINTKSNGYIKINTKMEFIGIDNQNFSFSALPGEYIAIKIEDNGTGMKEGIKNRLFEPFFTTKDRDGTGLGLASVYGFVKQFNGFITVESTFKIGSQFTIYLPITGIFQEEKEESKIFQKTTMSTNKIKNKTLVFVEDNPDILDLYSNVLSKVGFTVLTATNGKEALNLIKTNDSSIELIISDLIMPEMDGYTLIEELEKAHIVKKIIFVSGYSVKNPSVDEYASHITFLNKPFQIDDLLQSINNLLEL